MANYSLPVDDKSPRHRQSPGIVAVETGQIRTEGQIQFAQIGGKLENETEFFRDRVALVLKEIKFEVMLFGRLAEVRFALRGKSDEVCTSCADGVETFL
ncbi:MAG TPA: hypothetical protein VMU43_01760 [Candidatus Acidoferrum sp.]|nr:hypothetical protein [Candidatus Acidoferrum sp.]